MLNLNKILVLCLVAGSLQAMENQSMDIDKNESNITNESHKAKRQKIEEKVIQYLPSLPTEIWGEILSFAIYGSKINELSKNYSSIAQTNKTFNKLAYDKFKTLANEISQLHKDFKRKYERDNSQKLDLDKNINEGARIRLPGEITRTYINILKFAITRNNFEAVKFIVLKGADVNYDPVLTECSALLLAARNNFYKIAEFLIENGADINYRYVGNGNRPLLSALRRKSIDVAKLLIQKGARLDVKDSDRKTPLKLAKENGLDELTDLIIKKSLYKEIKEDIFVYHMERYDIDFLFMAGGNADLAKDVEILYNNFRSNTKRLQEKLDEFCLKWKLDPINFADACKNG